MGEIAQNHRIGRKRIRTRKLTTRVDFTPMVDLGFLLITFFMLATNLTKPQTMEIALPSRDKAEGKEQTTVKSSRAVTILLGKDNQVFYYEGTRENGVDPVLSRTDYSPSGLRRYLVSKNYDVMIKVRDLATAREQGKISDEQYNKQKSEVLRDKSAPIVLIKATDESVYRNLIDVLDEMAICNIDRYAITDVSPFDLDLLEKYKSVSPGNHDTKQ